VRSIGDPILTAHILTSLGYAHMASGDYLHALQTFKELNTIRQKWSNHINGLFFMLGNGNALFHAGQYLQSRLVIEEGLRLAELSEDLFFQKDLRQSLRQSLNDIFLALGEYDAVLNNEAFAGSVMDENDQMISSFDRGCAHLVFQRWDQAEQELTCFQQIYDSGSVFIAVLDNWGLGSIGGTQALLGYLAYRRRNPKAARQFLIRALENGLETGFYIVLCYSLAVVSLMLCEKGDLSDGTELYTIAFAHPFIRNSRFMQDAFGKYIEPLVSQLPLEVLQAAQEQGRQQTREEAAQEWLERLRKEPNLLSPKS